MIKSTRCMAYLNRHNMQNVAFKLCIYVLKALHGDCVYNNNEYSRVQNKHYLATVMVSKTLFPCYGRTGNQCVY